jgi:hypothetical protein
MNLWCAAHGRIHRFTPSATERVIYALQAMLADKEMDDTLSPPKDEPRPICLEEALRSAGSVEGYREHVDALRERRLRTERVRRPQFRGRPS